MELLFGILVGAALSFIFIKWISSEKESKDINSTPPTQNDGGSGGSGANQVPKNNIK